MSAITTRTSRTRDTATSAPDIITFVKDERFLGLSISPAQETLLRGIYGLPLVTDEQREIWALCTERDYPRQPFSEVMVISGVRGGKDSRIAAPIVLYEAIFGGHEHRLAKGETGAVVDAHRRARGHHAPPGFRWASISARLSGLRSPTRSRSLASAWL